MEEFVKDALLLNEFHDLCLLRLVELTVAAIRTERPLFSSLIEEPSFYRKYFQVWIREALDEKEKLLNAQSEDVFQ